MVGGFSWGGLAPVGAQHHACDGGGEERREKRDGKIGPADSHARRRVSLSPADGERNRRPSHARRPGYNLMFYLPEKFRL